MEKITVEREAYVFDQTEKNKLIQCLQYCKHRAIKHFKAHAGDVKFIEYLLLNLEKSFNSADKLIEYLEEK